MAPREAATTHSAGLYSGGSKHRAIRLRRAVRAIAGSGTDSLRRPGDCELDCMENDYYRFLHYPRG